MIRQGYSCRPLTLDEIHILLSAQYYAFFEIVRHKLEKDEALDRIHLIADFSVVHGNCILRKEVFFARWLAYSNSFL